MALSSDQTSRTSSHRKTSLSVKNLSPMLPTPLSPLSLPSHRAELPELKTTDTQSYQNKVLYIPGSCEYSWSHSHVIPAWFTGKQILKVVPERAYQCHPLLLLLTPPTRVAAPRSFLRPVPSGYRPPGLVLLGASWALHSHALALWGVSTQ